MDLARNFSLEEEERLSILGLFGVVSSLSLFSRAGALSSALPATGRESSWTFVDEVATVAADSGIRDGSRRELLPVESFIAETGDVFSGRLAFVSLGVSSIVTTADMCEFGGAEGAVRVLAPVTSTSLSTTTELSRELANLL